MESFMSSAIGKFGSKLHGNKIVGWIAIKDSNELDIRTARLEFQNGKKFTIRADVERDDLKEKGINKGIAGFIFELPEEEFASLPAAFCVSLFDNDLNVKVDKVFYKNPYYFDNHENVTNYKPDFVSAKKYIFPKDGKYSIIEKFNASLNTDREDCKKVFSYHIEQLKDLNTESNRINLYMKEKIKFPKIVVFSSCTNSYDEIRCPKYLDPKFEYVLFTDSEEYESGIWNIRRVPYWSCDPTRISRFVKTHPHYLFGDYDVAIWVDTNICIAGDISEEIAKFLDSGKPIGAFYHPLRKSIYDEAAKCIELGKDDIDEINQQINRYKSLSYDNNDLIESNFMMFNIKHPKLSNIMNTWWAEIDRFSKRDQLSLNFAIDKNLESWYPLANQSICTRNHEKIIYYPHKLMDDFAKTINSSLFNKKVYPSSNNFFCLHKDDVIKKHSNLSADVIIPVYNALDDLIKCIESLKKYRKNCMYRCIIIDDASEKDTQEYILQLTRDYEWIDSIRNQSSLGYGRAVNVGINKSKADFLVLLNSDTILTDGWIEKMADAVFSTPGAGIVGPISNAASYQSIPYTKGENKQTAVNPIPKGLSPDLLNSYLESWTEFGNYPRVPLIHGFCMGITKDVINEIGGFDEVHFPKGYGEENDFCFRATNAGYSLVIATNTYIFHAKSKSYTQDIRIPLMEEGSATLASLYGKKRINRAVESISTNPILKSLQIKAEYLYKYAYSNLKKVFIVRRKSLDSIEDINWWLRVTPWLSDSLARVANVCCLSSHKKLPNVNEPGICYIHENIDDFSDIELSDWIEKWKSKGGRIIYDIACNPFNFNEFSKIYKLPSIDAALLMKRMQWLIKNSDAITCTSNKIAAQISRFNSNITVLPYSFNKQLWHLDIKELDIVAHNDDEKCKLGILDLSNNKYDYSNILEVAKKIEKSHGSQICFNHICLESGITIGKRKSLPKKQDYTNLIQWLFQVVDWDIVVIPKALIDSEDRDLLFKICMSLGLCIVCEMNDDLPSYVENGYNCVVVDPSNIENYLNAIIDLIIHDEQRMVFAQNSKVTAQTFDSDIQSICIENLIYSNDLSSVQGE